MAYLGLIPWRQPNPAVATILFSQGAQDNIMNDKEQYKALLDTPQWKMYRSIVIELFGGKCQECGDSECLQVHHVRYIPELKPWQYKNPDDIAVLCENCHRREHGLPTGPKNTKFKPLTQLLDSLMYKSGI